MTSRFTIETSIVSPARGIGTVSAPAAANETANSSRATAGCAIRIGDSRHCRTVQCRAMRALSLLIGVVMTTTSLEAASSLDQRIDDAANKVESRVIDCRRDIHQQPEL